MRKLKGLGLALAAMLVIGAMAVPAASADEFTAEQQSASLTGSLYPPTMTQFLVTIGIFECYNPTYTDVTATTPTTSISVTPNFTAADCTMGGGPITLDMNGCSYKFNIQGGTGTAGDMDLVCPAGSEITYTLTPFKCIIHIKAQNEIGGTVTYSTVGAGSTREIIIFAEPQGIFYTHTKGFGLGSCESGSSSKGSMFVKLTITAENSAGTNHVGIFLSNV